MTLLITSISVNPFVKYSVDPPRSLEGVFYFNAAVFYLLFLNLDTVFLNCHYIIANLGFVIR